ncbi:hypothetical protein CARUB_v10019551mg [Capsella rubella]|uniref:F-box domain-containing protein n=1 Tax=Capsella rubella TaxID=81985 RepID=R0HLM1_9BRAS|nr:hypothetical protein CARUB_v10019551mg [Capsella rubella]
MASIDHLPNDLLVQILSLLPTKQAVTTYVLSKRWRTLFWFRQSLDFDNFDRWQSLDPDDYDPRNSSMIERGNNFMDFVTRSLDNLAFQGGNHVNKLSLKLMETFRFGDLIDRWICNALEHGVHELQLSVRSPRDHYPSIVFTNTTLVNLSLGKELYIPRIPLNASLPTLKILFLDSIYFKRLDFISSQTIKTLSVVYDGDVFRESSGVKSLDTPSVVDLYYSDCARPHSPHCNLDSLVKATLEFSFPNRDNRFDMDVTDIINGIQNVKTLHLTSSAVEVLSACCKGGLLMFNNLVDLVFSSKKRGWRVFLPLLLEHSPNLKTLLLSDLHRYTFGRKHRFVGVRIPTNNQVYTLRIMEYQGSVDELKHITHFLLNMKCLELLKVYFATTTNDPKKVQLTEDLLKLHKDSTKLKIQVM